MNALRTVRLDKRLGWPGLVDSTGVVGVEDVPQGRYVALVGEPASPPWRCRGRKPSEPHLVYANAPLRVLVARPGQGEVPAARVTCR